MKLPWAKIVGCDGKLNIVHYKDATILMEGKKIGAKV
jgi:hypothetical protein